MRILFDHCVPQRLRNLLTSHQIITAGEMGWDQLRNGRLLTAAAASFDVMVTVDRNMRHQQNLATLPVAVIVLTAKSNRLADLTPLAPAIMEALKNLQPRTFVEITEGGP
jgi:predicted nuclease of predicted toxin-antitoxin system